MGGCCTKEGASILENHDALPGTLVQHRRIQNIKDYFDIDAIVGKGAFGYVCLVTEKASGIRRAMKIVEVSKLQDRAALRNELFILKHLRHSNIVSLYNSYEDSQRLYMTMSLCLGGDLFNAQRKDKRIFTEGEVANIIKSLLSAISYLHRHHICHRDLKLENLLLVDGADPLRLVLCDFGFSKVFFSGQHMRQLLGTYEYLAPEVIAGYYTEACDMWAIGVLCYELIAGVSPFKGENKDVTMKNILDYKLAFPPAIWSKVSKLAKEFVRALLQEDPTSRMSPEQALRHKWLAACQAKQDLFTTETSEPERHDVILEKLVRFSGFSQTKKLMLLVVAFVMENFSYKESIRRSFIAFDRSGLGVITLQDFIAICEDQAISSKDAKPLFGSIDQARDDELNIVEFAAATINPRELDEKYLKAAFEHMNIEEQGKINEECIKTFLGPDYVAESPPNVVCAEGLTYEEFLVYIFQEYPKPEEDVCEVSKPSLGSLLDPLPSSDGTTRVRMETKCDDELHMKGDHGMQSSKSMAMRSHSDEDEERKVNEEGGDESKQQPSTGEKTAMAPVAPNGFVQADSSIMKVADVGNIDPIDVHETTDMTSDASIYIKMTE